MENKKSDTDPGYLLKIFSNQYTGHKLRFDDFESGFYEMIPFV